MSQCTASFCISDSTHLCGDTEKRNSKENLCLYFDECFFLHGNEKQLRHFVNLILSVLPEESENQVPTQEEVDKGHKAVSSFIKQFTED